MTDQAEPYRNPDLPVEKRVADLLSRMTTEEKIAQLRAESEDPLYLRRDGAVVPTEELCTLLDGIGIGKLMSILRADPFTHRGVDEALTPRECAEFVNAIHRYVHSHSRLGIPVMIGNEANHCLMGLGATIFPAACSMGCTFDTALMEEVAAAIAAEARPRGEVILYAPDLDTVRDPRYGRSDQNYGEDPFLVASMGVAMVRGLQGDDITAPNRVAAMLRCYPGSGDAEGGHDFGDTSLGEIEMHEVVLRPWQEAVAAGAHAVMGARSTYDHTPLWANHAILTKVLRDRWGFQGFVMTDGWLDYLMECRIVGDRTHAAAEALRAGVDMAWPDAALQERCHGNSRQAVFGRLADAVAQGLISLNDIDVAVARVLRVKFLLGLFENPYADPDAAEGVARCPAHRELAKRAARESIVLLKNDAGILPLSAATRTIAVVGPNADDHWAQLGDYAPAHRREDVVTILDGIRSHAPSGTRVIHAKGCGIRSADTSGIPEAVAAAEGADVVVAVVGGSSKGEYVEVNGLWTARRSPESDCGEGTDRMSLHLLGAQQELLSALKETGKPLVLVLVHGRAMEIGWIAANADAVIDAWYPGEAGEAVGAVLFGRYNPGGRLAVSIPRSVGQLPVYYYGRNAARSDYVEMDAVPLYPFGYGLSYSTFEYTDIHVDPPFIAREGSARVSVEVTNRGPFDGDEVVQLYVRDEVASVVRPWKQLKGFRRVHLAVGESRRVEFSLGPRELSFYGMDAEWVVEAGVFTVMIGRNAQEETLSAALTVG